MSATHQDAETLSFLAGGGEMGARFRSYPWSASPLGLPGSWPLQLRTLVRLMLDSRQPMLIIWGDTRIRLYNDGFVPIYGASHPETFGGSAKDAVWGGLGRLVDKVFAGEAVHMVNIRLTLNRGEEPEEAYFDFSYTPVRSDDGSVAGLFGVCIERTEQVLAEEALREREEQLRLATEIAEIGLWDLHVPSNKLYWTPTVKKMFGIAPDAEVSMRDFFDGLHPDDATLVRTRFFEAADPGRRILYDIEYRTIGREDKAVRWVAAKGRGIFDDQGVCVRMLGTAIDITARKLADEKLHELNETLERRVADAIAERRVFAQIVEETDTLIQVADTNYEWLAVNRAIIVEFEQLFGVAPRVGASMFDLVGRDAQRRQEAKALWDRVFGGEEFTLTSCLLDQAGAPRYYDMKFSPLRDRDGHIIAGYCFAYNVTERVESQARLVETEEKLRQAQKIEAIGQLTGGVAHDFNNLLMVISGGLSILDRQKDPDRRQRIMDGMQQAAERGASLSRQLLAFSRRQPLKPEPTDLARRIAGMGDLLDRTLRGDVAVETRFADALWPAQTDAAELELVILNLCVNARDAMPHGGTITIEVSNAGAVDEEELKGDFVQLTISDTGTGMPKAVLDRVFEPFFTTKEIGKGSGLGLPQVHGFASQSGGSVRIDSVVGRGTTVTLLLPRAVEAIRAPASGARAAAPAIRAGRANAILLVEDDDDVAGLVSEMLLELGYSIRRAASAKAALDLLADSGVVDLIFSDIMMPGGMNGVELAREVRRTRPDLPILLTSGYAAVGRGDAEAAGIAILQKPYKIEDLAISLQRAVETA